MDQRADIFSYAQRQREFDSAFHDYVGELLKSARRQLIPSENELSYSHGRRWQTVSSSDPDSISELHTFSHEFEIKFQDVVDNKISIITASAQRLANNLMEAFQRHMYQQLADVCEQSGNVTSSKDFDSPSQLFLDALKKIQFGVDRRGEVSLPEFHLSPKAFEKLVEDAEAQGDEFKDKIRRITEEKKIDSIKRDKIRKSRFKPYTQ